MTSIAAQREASRVKNISELEKAITHLNTVQKTRQSPLLADIINALSEMKDDIFNRKHNRHEPVNQSIGKAH